MIRLFWEGICRCESFTVKLTVSYSFDQTEDVNKFQGPINDYILTVFVKAMNIDEFI